MAQRIDRVEARGTTGRRVAEGDAYGAGKEEGDDVDLKIEVERHVDHLREADAQAEREQNAEQAAGIFAAPSVGVAVGRILLVYLIGQFSGNGGFGPAFVIIGSLDFLGTVSFPRVNRDPIAAAPRA